MGKKLSLEEPWMLNRADAMRPGICHGRSDIDLIKLCSHINIFCLSNIVLILKGFRKKEGKLVDKKIYIIYSINIVWSTHREVISFFFTHTQNSYPIKVCVKFNVFKKSVHYAWPNQDKGWTKKTRPHETLTNADFKNLYRKK